MKDTMLKVTIAGFLLTAGGFANAIPPSPVPVSEPSILGIFALGVIALCVRRFKK